MLVRTMHPSNAQCSGLGACKTPYFRTYSRHALYIFPKLCTVIELVETIKKCVNYF